MREFNFSVGRMKFLPDKLGSGNHPSATKTQLVN